MKNVCVPYTQARALKKLGFDVYCLAYYMKGSHKLILKTEISLAAIRDHTSCKTPLYQQAFRWFREKYNMYCPIMPADLGKYEEGNPDFQAGIYTREPVDVESLNTFKTYEEAELACLKKLIEIIKPKQR